MAVSQGTMDKKFVSAIDFLDQRDIRKEIFDQSRSRAFTDIMKIVDRVTPAIMYNYHNFVNSDVRELGTVSAVSSQGNATAIFTINTAAGFPRVGDMIQSSNPLDNGVNGAKEARIQAVGAIASGTIQLTVKTGGSLQIWYSTVGDIISFSSNAFSEKSDAPTNRRYSLTKYFNLIQIFREVDEITDVQKVARIEVEVNGDYGILPYQVIQKKIKMEGDISVAMLCGEKSDTQFGDASPWLTDVGTGYAVQLTGGLDWYCINYGINDAAAVLGTFGFTELDKIVDNWIANKAPTDQMGFMGSRAYGVLSKFFKNLGSSGVNSVRLVIDGRTMDFEVEQVDYRGCVIDFVHVPIFDDPTLFSATISPDVNGSIYFVPKGSVDTVDNGQQPYLQIRTVPSPMYGNTANSSNNGRMAEWRQGAMVGIGSVMYLQTNWYAAQGLEGLAPKHFQKFRVI